MLLKSIFCLLCFIRFLEPVTMNACENPALVMLRGACSSGKNTLCDHIQAHESNLHVIDLDSIYMSHVVDLVAETFPEEFDTLSQAVPPYNLYHALKRNEVLLKGEALEALTKIQISLEGPLGSSFQSTLRKKLKTHLLEQIEMAFEEGKNVLMNTWLPMGFIEEHFKSHPTVNVLVYSSLPAGFEMLKKRNRDALDSGNLSNKRFLGQLLSSFNSLFYLTMEEGEHSIGVNSLTELESVFEKARDEVVQNWNLKQETIFSQREMNLLDLANIKKEIIPEDAQGSIPLFIQPKKQFDITLCTQNKSVEELVAQLFEELENKK